MYSLIRKILGYKTSDQKYNQYFMTLDKLKNIDVQLNEMSYEFTTKNELHKSICENDLYEDVVKDRVREKFADFMKSYGVNLSNLLDEKEQLETVKDNLLNDPSLFFNDLKKSLLAGVIDSQMYLEIIDRIEKAKNPKNKVSKVMKEFKEGSLKSGSGDKVKDKDQAIAIAMKEANISKGDIDENDPCWHVDDIQKAEPDKKEKEVPGNVRETSEDEDQKETSIEEVKEKDFQKIKKSEDVGEDHLKYMVKEHERLIPLLSKYADDPEVAQELATQKEELARYSGMINKAEEEENVFEKFSESKDEDEISKAKAGTYADNEYNRRLGRAGQKYGKAQEDEEEEPKHQLAAEKDAKKKDAKPKPSPADAEEEGEEEPVPKVASLDLKDPKIKKLLAQAKKTSKQNLEAAIKESDDAQLRAVAQQELERRKKEEGVSTP